MIGNMKKTHNCKNFDKYIKEILKNKDFSITKSGRKSTIKIKHKSGVLYSTHPGELAIRPLKKWIDKLINQ